MILLISQLTMFMILWIKRELLEPPGIDHDPNEGRARKVGLVLEFRQNVGRNRRTIGLVVAVGNLPFGSPDASFGLLKCNRDDMDFGSPDLWLCPDGTNCLVDEVGGR